jgi:hypothetical protein
MGGAIDFKFSREWKIQLREEKKNVYSIALIFWLNEGGKLKPKLQNRV